MSDEEVPTPITATPAMIEEIALDNALSKSSSNDSSDSKTIEEQVAEMLETHTPSVSADNSNFMTKKGGVRKFSRIRTFVQKLNEEFIATLYETEQRHKAEKEALIGENEVLLCKVKTLNAQEEEHVTVVKQTVDRLQKLEAQEANHKVYMQKAGEKISMMEQRAKEMEAREGKVIDLAKKAAIKIKQLEARDKKHTAYAKKAALNTKKLKQMLVEKHDELEGVSERALTELDVMAQELVKANNKAADLQATLYDVKKQHEEELKLRKAETKKISSLRKMIEQYDGGVDCSWTDLSQAFSEEANKTVNLLDVYRGFTVESGEDFVEVCERIHESIPESTKKNYNQVGFFKKNGYHFPVLALGPFSVTPGSLRDQWLENANNDMLGVYYYGQENESLAYDMIPADSFIPYEAGVAQNFHIIPVDILDKSHSEQGLSPMEAAYEAGIKKINMEARSAPEERLHPQKATEEAFQIKQQATDNDTVSTSESLLVKLKEKIIGDGSVSRKDQLLAELEEIDETEQVQEELVQEKLVEKNAAPVTLRIDVEEDPEAVSVTESTTGSVESEGDHTMTSLEEQMNSFMADISASKTTAVRTTPRSVASPRADSSYISVDEPSEDQETREDIDSKPSFEKFQGTSLVKDRLKMFSGQPSSGGKPPSGAVITAGGSTKSVMQMWKNKAASSTTPKQGNTSNLKKAFSFNSTTSKKSKKTSKAKNVVTIPKNIQAKLDAGEALTDHEKEIMEGIQKFLKNSTPRGGEDTKDVIISPMMSNVSAMTFDQSVTAE